MELFGVQFMNSNIPESVRETCQRYGEHVIGTMLAGGYKPSTSDLQEICGSEIRRIDARDWLTERNSLQEYRERWIPLRDLILEIAVIGLIGWEIHLGYQQESNQAGNFKEQQRVLKDLAGNTQTTAKILGDLETTTEKMKNSIEQELIPQAQRSATASERSAKASEASSNTAVNALHLSERAYVSVQIKINAPLKVGEKASFTSLALNSGKTTAKSVTMQSRSYLAPTEMSLAAVHELAFMAPLHGTISKAIIASQGNLEQRWTTQDKIDEGFLALIKDKKMILRLFVDLTYEDEFKVEHHAQACAFYNTDGDTMSICESFNTSD